MAKMVKKTGSYFQSESICVFRTVISIFRFGGNGLSWGVTEVTGSAICLIQLRLNQVKGCLLFLYNDILFLFVSYI